MSKWRINIEEFLNAEHSVARIEITKIKGSAPREVGAWMLAGQKHIYRTIGGGQLELQAIGEARKMLASGVYDSNEQNILLGPDTGQCCGGVVSLRITTMDHKSLKALEHDEARKIANLPEVLIFGAGHVGLALAEALSLLPVKATLIDTRENYIFSGPESVERKWTSIPECEVKKAREGSAFVILTHDHALDFLIAREALAREDAIYVGMIGSKTKRATFRNWLKRENGCDNGFENLICPIGGTSVDDKRPAIIASLVTAEITTTLFQNSKVKIEREIPKLKIVASK